MPASYKIPAALVVNLFTLFCFDKPKFTYRPSMLCATCETISFVNLDKLGCHYRQKQGVAIPPTLSGLRFCLHHPDLASFIASRAQGCHLCMLLWHCIFESSQASRRSVSGPCFILSRCVDLPSEGMILVYGSNFEGMLFVVCGTRFASLNLVNLPDRFASFSDRITLYSGNQVYMDTHTGSLENLRLASLWVESCLSEHSKCVKSQQQLPRLPTRVIDVGNQNDSKPFLFEPKGGRGAYFTLSYCWGDHRGLTTSATYKNYCNEIPLDSLPRTFHDAIKVTRSFGCRFLWLDSLCIIQDVEQDKHREVTLMGEIYRNALLTIAAAKGADPDAGLFAEREPRTQRPCRLPSRLIGIIPESFVCTELDSKRANLNTLDLRAWVLQETVLSTRLLIFGRDRLEWSCLEGQASEKEPVPGGYRTVYERFRNLIYRPIGSPRKSISLSSGTHVLEWYNIVENYSNRFLTRSEDILPAISALASRMHDLHGGTYLAGLWKEDIQGGLCWYIQSQRKLGCHTRPLHQTAPSWSWASRTNAVIRFLPRGRGFFNPSRELGLSLEIANCFPRSTYQNRYGEVDGGFLLARGALKPAIAVFKTDTEDLQDTFLGTDIVATGWIAVVRDPVSHRETGVVAFDEQPQGEEKTSEIVCFLTQVYEFPVPLGLQFACLALIHTGPSEEEYRRVGLVTLSDRHWFGCPESQTFINHRKTVKIV